MYASSENLASRVEEIIAGCLLASQRIRLAVYVNDTYKEQRKVAGIRSEYDKIIVYNLLSTYVHQSYNK